MAPTPLELAIPLNEVSARGLKKRDDYDFHTTRIVIAVVCIFVSLILIIVGAVVRNKRRKKLEELLQQVIDTQAQPNEQGHIPMTTGVGHENASQEEIQKPEANKQAAQK